MGVEILTKRLRSSLTLVCTVAVTAGVLVVGSVIRSNAAPVTSDPLPAAGAAAGNGSDVTGSAFDLITEPTTKTPAVTATVHTTVRLERRRFVKISTPIYHATTGTVLRPAHRGAGIHAQDNPHKPGPLNAQASCLLVDGRDNRGRPVMVHCGDFGQTGLAYQQGWPVSQSYRGCGIPNAGCPHVSRYPDN